MKIRSDFVTNSSSSSFTVTLEIETLDGKKLIKDYGSDDPEFGSDISVYGDVADLLNAATVGDLMEKLDISGDDEDEEWNEEDTESDNIEDNPDAKIKSVVIKRTWNATGEWSSTFGYNVDTFLPDLKMLCQKVTETDGEAKEHAKKELQEYLNNVGELEIVSGSGNWPSNMCRGNGINKIDWKNLTGNIEELAEMVINDDLPSSSDRGEEILKLDYAGKTAEAVNIYYLE